MSIRRYEELSVLLEKEQIQMDTYFHLSCDAQELGEWEISCHFNDKFNIHAFKAQQIIKQIEDL